MWSLWSRWLVALGDLDGLEGLGGQICLEIRALQTYIICRNLKMESRTFRRLKAVLQLSRVMSSF